MSKDNGSIKLEEFMFIINDSKRGITGAVLICLILGYVYITITAPVYKVDALLQVEDKSKLVGELTDISKIIESRNAVSEKVRLIKSRRVIGQVVDDLGLAILAKPRYLSNAARYLVESVSLQQRKDLTSITERRFSWRQEKIRVATFDVPDAYLEETFVIIKDKHNAYRIMGPNQKIIGAGVVGEPMEIKLGADDTIRLLITQLDSVDGAHFTLRKIPHLKAVNDLIETLKVEELDKRANVVQNYGLVQISLEGDNPERIKDIVNSVINVHVLQNHGDKIAKADSALKYLQEQMASVQDQLAESESNLNQYRLTKGSIDLTKETDAFIARSVDIETKLSELKRTRNDLLHMFTPKHVRIVSLNSQIDSLSREREELDQKILDLPDTQQEILRLSRDVEVNRELYTVLLNQAQELKVVKAEAGENTRIIDSAVIPIEPIRPKKQLVLLLFVFFGLLAGTGWALIRKSLYGGIDDPDEVERLSGLPVYAVVPNSEKKSSINWFGRLLNRTEPRSSLESSPHNYTVESLRSLRTTLNNIQRDAGNELVLVTGPSPDVGKSFISVNLGAVWARTSEKVLLIDADLRKGGINHYLNMEGKVGLSELITGSAKIAEAIHKTDIDGFYVIPSGEFPTNPSELLSHPRFTEVVNECRKMFDKVIIDSPPVLGVSDAAIIGRNVGITLLVLKAGQHRIREIGQVIKNLKQAGVSPNGIVFNNMKMTKSGYGYGRYYGYAYTFTYKSK